MSRQAIGVNERDPRWVAIAEEIEVPEGTRLGVTVKGTPLVLIRHEGTVSVFQGLCPHRGIRLANGNLKDGILTCLGHGWQFDCRTGGIIRRSGESLRSFPVEISDGKIWVDQEAVVAWDFRATTKMP